MRLHLKKSIKKILIKLIEMVAVKKCNQQLKKLNQKEKRWKRKYKKNPRKSERKIQIFYLVMLKKKMKICKKNFQMSLLVIQSKLSPKVH
jgi:hypothetical protein